MKKALKIIIPVLIIAAGIAVGLFLYRKTGIIDFVENKRTESTEKDVVLTISGKSLNEKEARAYLASMKNQVESIYGSEIWDYKLDEKGTNYAGMMKERMLDKIIFIKLVCANASGYGVELTADDRVDIDGYVNEFFANISEDTASEYDLTNELVTKIYSENMLAEKVYDKITLNYKTTANEDNCRQADFLRMVFSKTYINEDGETITYTGEDLENVKSRAQAAYTAAKDGDFKTVALAYNPEADAEVTCGLSDLPQGIGEKIMALGEGSISEVLEAPDAFYIYYCKKAKNEEATASAVQKRESEERDEYFMQLYEGWRDNADIVINTDKWENLNY